MRPAVLGCAGILLGALDFGFMTLAGPAIDRDLHLGGAYPWLFSAGSFGYGAVLMPAGRLVERSGPYAVLRAGLSLYVGGLATAVIAREPAVVLVGRALVGIGGGALTPAALALLAGVPVRRGLAFASSGGAVAAGFVSGVLLGSIVVEAVGWRWALLALCPPILALAPLTRGVGESAAPATPSACEPAGALAIGGAAILVAAGLSVADRASAACACALGAAAAIVRAALRRAGGWLPAGAPARRLAAVCVAGATTTASGVGAAALLGRALPQVGGLSAAQAGLALAAFGLAIPLAVPAARALAGALGPAASCGIGLAGQAVALAALAALPLTVPAAVVVAIAAFGAGHVVANAGAAQAAMELARRAGPTAGLLATAQYAGAGIGALVILAIAGGDAPTAAGIRTALLVAAGIAVVGAHAVLFPRRLFFTHGRERKAGGTEPHLFEAPGHDPGRGVPAGRVRGGRSRPRGG
jgi:MFS family permease